MKPVCTSKQPVEANVTRFAAVVQYKYRQSDYPPNSCHVLQVLRSEKAFGAFSYLYDFSLALASCIVTNLVQNCIFLRFLTSALNIAQALDYSYSLGVTA